MHDEEVIRRFAEEWAQTPKDAFRAALAVLGDAGQALVCAKEWERNPEIIALRNECADAAFYDDTPIISKNDVARKLLSIAEEAFIDAKDRIAALGKINEMYGYGKPAETTGGAGVVNNVLIMNNHGSNDEWEARAKAQQARLIEDAARTVN